MRTTTLTGILLFATLSAKPAGAWTAPQMISNAGTGHEASVPRIAPGYGSRVLVAYQQKDWRVRYRERSGAGNWGPIQVISPAGVFSVRPAVVEDSLERPHVIYAENDAGGALDLIDTWKEQGVWQRVKITNTPGRWDDFPSVRTDSTGRMHLASVDYIDGQGGVVVYRQWNNGAWSGPTTLGSVDSPYYRRADLSVDVAGNVHVAWSTTGGDKYVVNYRRYSGSTWSPTLAVGQSINQSFVSKVRIGAATPSSIVVAWDDGATRYVSSADGGANWTGVQSWSSFRVDNLQAAQGTAWLSGTDRANTSRVLICNWTGAAWSAAQHANPGEPRWKGWVDATATPDGAVHVVYDDVIDDNNTHEIAYVMQGTTGPAGMVTGVVRDQSGVLPGAIVTGSLGGQATTNAQGQYTFTSPVGTISVRASRPGYPDVNVYNVVVNEGQSTLLGDIVMNAVPPAAVTALVVDAFNSKVRLAWQNPTSPNFAGTMIRFRTDTYPSDPTDGVLLADRASPIGEPDALEHLGLTNGQTYYYALFAHDDRPVRSYAQAATGSGLPALKIDSDRDGDVDQNDFGIFQACLSGPFIPQVEPGCAGARLDADDDVDQDDVLIYLNCMSGPGVPADPTCLD